MHLYSPLNPDIWKGLDECRSNTAVDVIKCTIMHICKYMYLTMFSGARSHLSDEIFNSYDCRVDNKPVEENSERL